MDYQKRIKSAEDALCEGDRELLQQCLDNLAQDVSGDDWLNNVPKAELIRDIRTRLAQKIFLLTDKPEPEPKVVALPQRPQDPYRGWPMKQQPKRSA